MTSRTNDEWAILIATKVAEIHADTSSPDSNVISGIAEPNAAFAATIDHTLLKPDATTAQIDELCAEAVKWGFKSCCVNGTNIKRVSERLQGSSSIACAVIGFPLGAGKSSVKAFEAREAISDGAQEIDMVLNIGALKSNDYALVYDDIRAVVDASGDNGVKVILETVFLSPEQIIAASYLAAEAGAAFVKTCTGFNGGGASAEDVGIMWRTVKYKEGAVKVKASAGVRTFEKCVEMLKAGAQRIGTSSGAGIMQSQSQSASSAADATPGTY